MPAASAPWIKTALTTGGIFFVKDDRHGEFTAPFELFSSEVARLSERGADLGQSVITYGLAGLLLEAE